MTGPPEPSEGVDAVVVGGGFAGLAAAAALAESGRRVEVLEATELTGGAARLSAGVAWTFRDVDEFRRVDADADVVRAATLTGGLPRAVARLRSAGVPCEARPRGPRGRGVAWSVDVDAALAHWRASVLGAGGAIRTGSRAHALLRDGDRVVGVEARADGGMLRIGAPAIVLATGGFQGDERLRSRHIGPGASSLVVRSHPADRGDGLRMALAVGAGTSSHRSGFYGHLVPHPLDRGLPAASYNEVTFDFSEHCLVLNVAGERFVVPANGDPDINQAVVTQPGGRCFLVLDQSVLDEHARDGARGARLRSAVSALGGHVASSSRFEDVAEALTRWGMRADALRPQFESHLAEREGPRHPVPPFHAFEAGGSITLPFGGLATDHEGRVLTSAGAPVRGLYAIGADAGGLYRRVYGGGLAVGLAFAPSLVRAVSSDG